MSVAATPYPRVNEAIERFTHWLNHRREMREMAELDAAEFGRIAHDLGVASADLEGLVRQGTDAEEMHVLLKALGIDEAALERASPLLVRDLERVCAICKHKSECDQDIADGVLADTYRAYCGNAVTLDALVPPATPRPGKASS